MAWGLHTFSGGCEPSSTFVVHLTEVVVGTSLSLVTQVCMTHALSMASQKPSSSMFCCVSRSHLLSVMALISRSLFLSLSHSFCTSIGSVSCHVSLLIQTFWHNSYSSTVTGANHSRGSYCFHIGFVTMFSLIGKLVVNLK